MANETIFSAGIADFVAKAKENADLVVRRVTFDMFERVIAKTPVDTGRLKGSWLPAIGSIPSGDPNTPDKSGAVSISRVTATTLKAKAGDIIYMISNLVYSRRIEYGHSKQAPEGMVRTTISEFGAIVDKAANDVNK